MTNHVEICYSLRNYTALPCQIMERNYIKEYRQIRGIKSQNELARLAGVARSTLGEIERHKMVGDRDTLDKIANALGITVEELFVSPKR